MHVYVIFFPLNNLSIYSLPSPSLAYIVTKKGGLLPTTRQGDNREVTLHCLVGPGLGIYSRSGEQYGGWQLFFNKKFSTHTHTHTHTPLSMVNGEFERNSEKSWIEGVDFTYCLLPFTLTNMWVENSTFLWIFKEEIIARCWDSAGQCQWILFHQSLGMVAYSPATMPPDVRLEMAFRS